MFAVRTASTDAADALVEHLNNAGIGARHFWARLSDQAPYAAYPTHQGAGAKALSETLVSLPNSTTMTDEQVERVVSALESWRGAEVVI